MNTSHMQGVSWLKVGLVFVVCVAIRFIPPPFRAPNVEPVMASMMPLARQGGALLGFLFASLSMVLFDVLSGSLGSWTIVTALTYGCIGAFAPLVLSRVAGVRGYVSFAVLGTLVFDGITGVLMGPLLFGGSYIQAFYGQIPFTMMHLVGNMAFALMLSPLLEVWITKNTFLDRFSERAVFASRP